jgi:sugar lactone lactonase YvrE
LLTLRPLFGATEQTPTPELMQRIQYEEPERLRKYHPGLPRDLEAVVLKCLEKHPRQRYATARELAEELHRFLDREPVRARPVGHLERSLKWLRRRPARAALLVVSCLAMLALVGGMVGLWYSAWLQDVNQQLATALEEAKTAKQLAEEQGEQAEEARKRETFQRGNAEYARRREVAERGKAERAREELRLVHYFHQVSLAREEWRDNNVADTERLLNACPADLRGWEWHYVKRLCHTDLLTVRAHEWISGPVRFSPDGKCLASADGKTVRVWDARTGEELLTRGHAEAVSSLCFSPDGKRLASASQQGMVKVWDAQAGQEVVSFRGHDSYIYSVCFSPDGKRLASASADNVRVWDAETGQENLALQGHTDLVFSVCFSPDGQRLAGASLDKTVKVWDAQTGREPLSFKGHTSAVVSVCFSPGGQRLASALSCAPWVRPV